MEKFYKTLSRVVPEMEELLYQRLIILEQLTKEPQRIGRQALGQKIGFTERKIRSSINQLRKQELVDITSSGIAITNLGQSILQHFMALFIDAEQLESLVEEVKTHLGIENCLIVPGDFSQDNEVPRTLALLVQEVLMEHLDFGRNVIAVTGGETLSRVGRYLTSQLSKDRDILFVPARGGMEGTFDIQSSSVGAVMARKTQSRYVPLFIPENIDAQTSNILLADPSIRQVVEMGQQANCLIASVGTAQVMAERREVTALQRQQIQEGEAVGEVFGVFYDKDGQEVIRVPRAGLQLEDMKQIPLLLTVVGGAVKAEAVSAYYKLINQHGWLICDEKLAKKILNV